MRNHFASSSFASRNKITESNALYRVFEALNDETLVGVAIFAGIGLLAGLVAATSGVPGVWM
jgi:hypothetical protein